MDLADWYLVFRHLIHHLSAQSTTMLLSTTTQQAIAVFLSLPASKVSKWTRASLTPVQAKASNSTRNMVSALLVFSSSSPFHSSLQVVLHTGYGRTGPISLVKSDLVNKVRLLLPPSTFERFQLTYDEDTFDSEAPYIKYPILIIAGIVAAAQATPLLISSLWRSASTTFGRGRPARFTTRDSFARGRSDYAVVDDDEGELLGDESDEEV